MYNPKGPAGVSLADIKLLDIPKLLVSKGIDYIKNTFKTLKHYDINSLYPSAMMDFDYPTDIIGYFIGDITLIDEYKDLYLNNIGIYKVKVTAPKNIVNPILPVKVDGTTIYPEGTWTAWYYGEEIKNAIKLGYQFEILEGYLFEGNDLFSNYVNRLNQIKESSEPNSSMYTIAKFILNTVYGKFGMKPELLVHEVILTKNISDKIDLIGLENVAKTTEIGKKTLISYFDKFPKVPFINVAIALAVTANARIYMSDFKNNPDFVLYYSDTDSAYISKLLPAHLVDSKKLGLFKLEKVLTKFVALGPKMYGGRDINGNEFNKVKGLKAKVSLQQLEELLIKDSSKNVKQEKWFKDIKDSTIIVKSPEYNIRPTDNKRNLIYKDNVLVGTSNKIINI